MNPGPHGPEPCALPDCASPRPNRERILPGAVPTAGRAQVTVAGAIISVALASAMRVPSPVRSMWETA